MNLRDTIERLFWSVLAAALTNFGSIGLLDVAAWKAAALAGINGGATFLLVLARARLDVLPAPGEGLPGLPTDDTGRASWPDLVLFLVALVLGALCVKAGLIG